MHIQHHHLYLSQDHTPQRQALPQTGRSPWKTARSCWQPLFCVEVPQLPCKNHPRNRCPSRGVALWEIWGFQKTWGFSGSFNGQRCFWSSKAPHIKLPCSIARYSQQTTDTTCSYWHISCQIFPPKSVLIFICSWNGTGSEAHSAFGAWAKDRLLQFGGMRVPELLRFRRFCNTIVSMRYEKSRLCIIGLGHNHRSYRATHALLPVSRST